MPKLQIEATHLRTQNGQLVVVVWNDPKAFASDDSEAAMRTVRVAASAETVVVDVGELPEGQYVVAVLHDENSNDKLDVTPNLQLPTEGLGFSRNPKMGLKGPSWEACVFEHATDEKISVTVKYWR